MADHPSHLDPMSRRAFLTFIGGAATPLLLAACGAPAASPSPAPAGPTTAPQTEGTSVPARGGIVRIAFPIPITSLNFLQAPLSVETLHLTTNICENLVWLDSQWNLQPRLATAWESSEGGKVWTFKLREGVTFHHGTPFTAKDVVHTINRLKDPALGGLFAPNVSIIDTVEALTDMSVRFTLTAPFNALPALTSTAVTAIVAHDQSEEQYATALSGTGPYRFKENVPGERTILVRNEQYWEPGLPALDEVQFVYIADTNAQIAALTGGTIDVIPTVQPGSLPTLQASGNITINEIESGSSEILVMRIDQKPFDDQRVREAFKLVVDREGMIKAVLQGYGVVGNDQLIPPVSPFWANLPVRTRDIEQAKALLAEAGYPDGLEVTLYVSPAVPNSVEMGVAFQEMAKEAGITVNVERIAAEVYFIEYYMQKAFFGSYWGMATHPDELLNLAHRSDAPYNESGWASEQLDQLIDAARSESDEAKQKALYGELQKLISAEGGIIVPYFRKLLAASQANVQGIEFSPRYLVMIREAELKAT